jgi:hypothetical protein
LPDCEHHYGWFLLKLFADIENLSKTRGSTEIATIGLDPEVLHEHLTT